jgi:predicted RNase H-like HicB family nuclease
MSGCRFKLARAGCEGGWRGVQVERSHSQVGALGQVQRSATVLWVSALTFNVVFEDAGDGWVYAHVPELPEVHTQGEGLDDARVMVREAIELVLADRRERGDAIPATGWALVESVEIAA